ncbi:hypothetical protein Tco_0743691 [Tanacetum coccineum]
MGESSKSFLKKVSQFTTYSLRKDRKFSKKPQVFETPTPQKVSKSDSSKKKQVFETPNTWFTQFSDVDLVSVVNLKMESETGKALRSTRTRKPRILMAFGVGGSYDLSWKPVKDVLLMNLPGHRSINGPHGTGILTPAFTSVPMSSRPLAHTQCSNIQGINQDLKKALEHQRYAFASSDNKELLQRTSGI